MALRTILRAPLAFFLDSVGLASNKAEFGGIPEVQLDHGIGAGQADTVYSATRTLAASATENLDLVGSLVSELGAAASFAKVKAIMVRARPENTNNVIIGNVTNGVVLGFGAATQSWSIPPGGVFFVSAPAGGWSLTGGTADLLKVANSAGGTAVVFDIAVIGCSA